MTKTVTYSTFAIASLIIIMVFVTAENYLQLATAVVLYPALVFLGFMVFPRKNLKPKIVIRAHTKLTPKETKIPKPEEEGIPAYVADIDRRTFIKLIGATGISFFLVSLLGRQVENLIFNRASQSQSDALGSGSQPGPSGARPTEGYTISEVDEGPNTYFGFINKDGNWLIMKQDEDGTSFRYAKGSSDFPGNWASRENIKYDYFYNLP